MSRISRRLAELKVEGRAALIPYIMAGDPDLAATERLVLEIEKAGADMIELGVPFSDPLADGPTIQKAAVRALEGGTDIAGVLGLVRRLRARTEMPVILMLYYNLVFRYGEARFAADAAWAGVDGVIIPDLPPDEASGFIGQARRRGLDTIFLLAPTSSEERMRLVGKSATGFIYYVSLTGVTGARESLDRDIRRQVGRIRKFSDLPVCVGFGISRPDQAALVASWADGVIVGSALVKVIHGAKGAGQAARGAARFVGSLRKAMSAG
jgi:tryptophan synthase alpha chain